ncbi:hypothetical protein KCU65_g4400, partial [Aureobasidium melanogenum]
MPDSTCSAKIEVVVTKGASSANDTDAADSRAVSAGADDYISAISAPQSKVDALASADAAAYTAAAEGHEDARGHDTPALTRAITLLLAYISAMIAGQSEVAALTAADVVAYIAAAEGHEVAHGHNMIYKVVRDKSRATRSTTCTADALAIFLLVISLDDYILHQTSVYLLIYLVRVLSTTQHQRTYVRSRHWHSKDSVDSASEQKRYHDMVAWFKKNYHPNNAWFGDYARLDGDVTGMGGVRTHHDVCSGDAIEPYALSHDGAMTVCTLDYNYLKQRQLVGFLQELSKSQDLTQTHTSEQKAAFMEDERAPGIALRKIDDLRFNNKDTVSTSMSTPLLLQKDFQELSKSTTYVQICYYASFSIRAW